MMYDERRTETLTLTRDEAIFEKDTLTVMKCCGGETARNETKDKQERPYAHLGSVNLQMEVDPCNCCVIWCVSPIMYSCIDSFASKSCDISSPPHTLELCAHSCPVTCPWRKWTVHTNGIYISPGWGSDEALVRQIAGELQSR
jgi:hypothetical protein